MCRFVTMQLILTLRKPNHQAGEFDAVSYRSGEKLAVEYEIAISYKLLLGSVVNPLPVTACAVSRWAHACPSGCSWPVSTQH
jgi:hypothetical protein